MKCAVPNRAVLSPLAKAGLASTARYALALVYHVFTLQKLSVPCRTEPCWLAFECQCKRGIRESARLHNVPLETLRRRAKGMVMMDCRPGPKTVLTEEEESKLAQYLLEMSDMALPVNV